TSTTSNRFAHRMLSLHRLIKNNLVSSLLGGHRQTTRPTTGTPVPLPATRLLGNSKTAAVVDVDALLLNSSMPSAATLFPPFFLVAVEAGSFVRGFLLLALYPLLRVLKHGACLKAMAMVSFCGLRRNEAARIGRAVLPKYFFKEAAHVEALAKVAGESPEEVKVAAVSRTFPTVMVEAFLKDYVGFDAVVGREKLIDGLKQTEMKNTCHYPKPMIFHDGRLAFTPTPASALAMYIYFPFAIVLAVVRIAIYTILPRRMTGVAAALAGVRVRVTGAPTSAVDGATAGGRLYVCNHRTLLDAIAISSALGKSVFAVTYSLGRLSELISPIPLLRLTRGREEDRRRMALLLARGDVVVSPEGTTCREPYLLRFSPLFAELADEVSPVAVDERSTMFYGTSTSPIDKCFDSVYFLMNPRPEYSVHFLKPVPTGGQNSSIEVANQVQRVLADALGFTPTALTRKDKYMLLAGNEGTVATKKSN
uniref:Phospholipid/glycerol acyltransferase domain-containing protein n=1 Tax=Aegilops tauschii subsp. strangulata TaxID=200361 RepID=A0A453C6N7_AEGTS